MNQLDQVEKSYLRGEQPEFAPGDTVRIHVKVKEGDKERIQIFQGVIIARRGGGTRETFTARKMSGGEARCAGPSCTTCATCAARRPASKSAGTSAGTARPRPRAWRAAPGAR